MYQADRLTIGRSPTRFSEGQSQVIEKVVYKEDDRSLALATDLRNRLQEVLLQNVLMSIEVKALRKRAEKTTTQSSSFKVFENAMMYENQSLKTEVSRLNQMLADKEKEVFFVRDSEIRKSAIQTGEMSVRLGVLLKENQRLQNAQIEKINHLNQVSTQLHKVQHEKRVEGEGISNQSRIAELQKLVSQKDRELYELKQSSAKEISSRDSSIAALIAKLGQTEQEMKRATENLTMKQTDSLEISRLKSTIGSLQQELDAKASKIERLEQSLRAVECPNSG